MIKESDLLFILVSLKIKGEWQSYQKNILAKRGDSRLLIKILYNDSLFKERYHAGKRFDTNYY